MEEEKDLKDVIHEIEEENEKEALEKEKLEEAKVPETIEEVKVEPPVVEAKPVVEPKVEEKKEEPKKSKKKLIIIISIVVGVLLIAGIILLLLLGGTKKEYTVTFDSAGGERYDSITVKKGETVTMPSSPSKEGYIFECWEYQGACVYTIKVDKDITIKAKWRVDDSKKEFKVTIVYDNGNPEKVLTIQKGQKVPFQPDPVKEGYDFVGWEYGDGYSFYFEYDEINEDMTIRAKWRDQSEDEYVVNFNSDGGTPVQSQDVKKGGKAVEPKEPTKEGYTFVEWQLNNTKYDFSKEVNSNLTLKAKWQENITVTFDSNGGSTVPAQKVKYGETVTKPADPTKENATFEGWYLGNNKYNFEDKVTESITLKAKWQEKSQPQPQPSGNKVTCVEEEEEAGIHIKATIYGYLDNDNKISKLSYLYEFDDETTAKQYCDLFKAMYPNTQCSGKTISIPDIKEMMGDDEEVDELIGLTKEEFINKAKQENPNIKCS